jgi:Ca2+/Na+ antiporter
MYMILLLVLIKLFARITFGVHFENSIVILCHVTLLCYVLVMLKTGRSTLLTNKTDESNDINSATSQAGMQLSKDAAANSCMHDQHDVTSTNASAATAVTIHSGSDVTQTTPSRRRRRKHRQSTPNRISPDHNSNVEQDQEQFASHVSNMTVKPLGALKLKPLQQLQQQQAVVSDDVNNQSLLPSIVELNKQQLPTRGGSD